LGGSDHSEESILAGLNFQEEWDFVIDNSKVTDVFVTSWNEWVAQKFPTSGNGKQYVSFTDCFNMEYSRDVEPMKGGYGDNYLMQMASNIRRFKDAEKKGSATINKKTIDIDNPDSWNGIPIYRDPRGDAVERNHIGSWNYIYTDTSNRNDIISVAVASDEAYLYINAEVAFELIDSNEENWMNVYINNIADSAKGFAGYNYILNRVRDKSAKTAKLQKFNEDGTLSDVTDCDMRIFEKGITFRIPLSAMSMSAKSPKLALKVTDNIMHFNDPMDFYVSGDSAPIGGYSYGYGM